MPKRLSALSAPYLGTSPQITGLIAFAGAGASVLGRTTLGQNAWLGNFAVIRADGHYVEIGDDFFSWRRSVWQKNHPFGSIRFFEGIMK